MSHDTVNVAGRTLQYTTRSLADEIVQWRRHLHQHPEPSLKEYETAKFVKELLTIWDIPFEDVGETGVLGYIHGTKPGDASRTVLLRADMDALDMKDRKDVPYRSTKDGLHHACGHDGHTAALLGAAKTLKEQAHLFSGTIKLAFQPAEEIGAGARQFVAAGHTNDVDCVFGIHLSSAHPVGDIVVTSGPRYASCDIFKIHVQGEASHAARPNQGRDALLAASHIIVALQSIVSRTIDPLDPAVVGVGVLRAGTRYNVVANDAYIEGTVRALSHETRQHLLTEVERIAATTASIHHATTTFENYAAANPLINHEWATQFARPIAAAIVGDAHVITDAPPTLGGEDFADFLEVCEGTFPLVGTRNLADERTHYPHHHELFDIDEQGLFIAAELHIQFALTYLNR